MSLHFRCYKEVTRSSVKKLFDNLSQDTSDFATTSSYSEEKICFEFIKQGYDTFNKHIEWWRINFDSDYQVTVEPIYDERLTD